MPETPEEKNDAAAQAAPSQLPPPPPPLPAPVARKPRVTVNQDGTVEMVEIEDFYRMAQGVARAGFAPKTYLINPKEPDEGFSVDKIAIGMMFAKACGFHPLLGLRSIAVINGTPSVWGDGILGICQATMQMEDFSEQAIIAEADAPGYKAGDVIGYVCTTVRQGYPKPFAAKFTYEDAKRAGLTDKSGPWKEYRPRMYQMRARAWSLRAAFADRLNGIPMTEEVQDYIDVTPEAQSRAKAIEHKAGVNVQDALDKFAGSKQPEPVGSTASEADNAGASRKA